MKKLKKLGLAVSGLGLLLTLSGCSNSAVTSNSTGFWDHYVIWNFIQAIEALSKFVGNNYGWGIVVFTIIIRILILPLMAYQLKSMRKMSELQPEIKQLQQKYSAKDRQTQMQLREATQRLYAERGVNPFAGCLPLVVQMPILIALYQAIWRSDVLKSGSFLWMQLGDKDPYFILPVLAAVLTWVTSKLSAMSQPEQNAMTGAMTWGMPIMILIMALNVPAALSLYWVIANAFSAGQTLLINNPYKINAERKQRLQAKKARERKLAKAKRKALQGKKKK